MPEIKIPAFDGTEVAAYCASPASRSGSGLLVLQDSLGFDEAVRSFCDAYASCGCLVVCPDLLGHQKINAAIETEAELRRHFDVEEAVRDLISILGYIRLMPGCSGKVGCIGCGLGGRLAYLMSVRSDVDVSVSLYGTDIDKNLDEIQDIRMPLMMHLAGMDAVTSEEKRARIMARAGRNPVIAFHVYDGVGYGFADFAEADPGDAARLAFDRSKDFLAESLLS